MDGLNRLLLVSLLVLFIYTLYKYQEQILGKPLNQLISEKIGYTQQNNEQNKLLLNHTKKPQGTGSKLIKSNQKSKKETDDEINIDNISQVSINSLDESERKGSIGSLGSLNTSFDKVSDELTNKSIGSDENSNDSGSGSNNSFFF